jgi:CDP-diacylglycerol---glycerol-3-phosphate 3-phosphatidyltransferase
MNPPNAVTLVRIALVPAMLVVLIETDGGSLLAASVFAIAASTDGIDGYLARSRREVTRFGKVIDPIADKLLIVTALVALVALDRLAAWVAIVIVVRELAVSGLRLAASRRGLVIGSSPVGRLKTGSQVAAVLALIAADDPDAVWVMALVYTAVGITVVSGIDYFRRYRGEVAA